MEDSYIENLNKNQGIYSACTEFLDMFGSKKTKVKKALKHRKKTKVKTEKPNQSAPPLTYHFNMPYAIPDYIVKIETTGLDPTIDEIIIFTCCNNDKIEVLCKKPRENKLTFMNRIQAYLSTIPHNAAVYSYAVDYFYLKFLPDNAHSYVDLKNFGNKNYLSTLSTIQPSQVPQTWKNRNKTAVIRHTVSEMLKLLHLYTLSKFQTIDLQIAMAEQNSTHKPQIKKVSNKNSKTISNTSQDPATTPKRREFRPVALRSKRKNKAK
ncbi:MAG: hypothetical protein ACTSRS_21175 [Candidatus Helarchaeota archaeon]